MEQTVYTELELFRVKILHKGELVLCKPSQDFIQQLHHLESKFTDLWVCRANLGTFNGRLEEILEMLSIDIFVSKRLAGKNQLEWLVGKQYNIVYFR